MYIIEIKLGFELFNLLKKLNKTELKLIIEYMIIKVTA